MKKKIFKIICTIIPFLLLGCIKNNESPYRAVPYIGKTNILFNSISLDTVSLDGSKTSLVGKWTCLNDKLIWGDYFYGSFYIYDTDYNFEKKVLSKGNGPNEIPAKKWVDYSINQDKIFILGSSYDYYIVNNKTWKKINSARLNFSSENMNMKELMNNPRPDQLGIYEVNYSGLNLSFLNPQEVLFSINTSHPKLNAYTSRTFYDETQSIGLLDVKNNKIKDMLGSYSPIYKKYEYIPQFSNVLFTKYNDKILYSFEADSLIYNLNKDLYGISSKFGREGENINRKYPEVKTTENYVEIYKDGRSNYGYYKYLKAISKTGVIFRGYQKDQPSNNTDGLQIYKDGILLGDVSVPKNFKIIGYIAPFYYAQISTDGFEESFTLFNFKLNI